MSKISIRNIAVTGSLLILFLIASTIAFFTSSDTVTNQFTVGNVKLTLIEDEYGKSTNDRRLAYAQTMAKDPLIKNTGKNDEIVFLKVTVPLKTVQFIAPNGEKSGSETLSEVFTIGSKSGSKQTFNNFVNNVNYNSSFEYDNKWVLLSDYPKVEGRTMIYLFGYTEILEKGEQTTTLFDTVTLKNILENNFSSEEIEVEAFGIQAEEIINKYTDANSVALGDDDTSKNSNGKTLSEIFGFFE